VKPQALIKFAHHAARIGAAEVVVPRPQQDLRQALRQVAEGHADEHGDGVEDEHQALGLAMLLDLCNHGHLEGTSGRDGCLDCGSLEAHVMLG
jgi:hypothetical protein